MSNGSNSEYILNTSCSSGSRSTTKKRSPENCRTTGVNIGDLNTRIGAEGINVCRRDSIDTSGSDIGCVEVGCPLPSSPRAGLQEKHEELHGKGGVHSSNRTSHANAPNSSSMSSYIFSTLGQLPAHFSTNGKSKNMNAMKCSGHVGFFCLFIMCFSGC